VNTPQQLELTDWKAPADAAEVDQLVRLLAAAGTWLTAEEITQQLSWTDRKIRKLASHSDGLIISGNSGYKHTRHATPDEFQEFFGRMTSQGKEMLRRAFKAKKVHHAHIA
jgi:hypothetical protein